MKKNGFEGRVIRASSSVCLDAAKPAKNILSGTAILFGGGWFSLRFFHGGIFASAPSGCPAPQNGQHDSKHCPVAPVVGGAIS